MKKQPERTAKTRQTLIDAFWKLYEEKPIEKITVRQIAEEAGVYRSTFYEYFSDVYAIRDLIERDIFASYEKILEAAPIIESLDEGMELLIAFYSHNAKYLAVILGSHGDAEFTEHLKDMIRGKLRQHFGLPLENPEIDILLEMVLSSVISLLNYWYTHQDQVTIREVIDIGSQVIQSGLLSFLKDRGIRVFGM